MEIRAGFDVPDVDKEGFDLYVKSIEHLIRKIVPLEALKKKQINPDDFFCHLDKMLPILHPTLIDKSPSTFSLALLCSANYTHGVGRFLCDIASRWLIPGRQLPIFVVRSLNFEFIANPGKNYFTTEIHSIINHPSDLAQIKSNLPNFIRETRLNILSVQHARYVVTLRALSFKEKKILIQENVSSLMHRFSKEFDQSIFDQMQYLLIKASAEDKVTQIKKQIIPLIQKKSKVFDRDIFSELQRFIYLFKDAFTAIREPKHLTRIIAYHYLFKKSILDAMANEPHKRHLTLKLFKTCISDDEKRPVLGILITLNQLRDNEIFEQRHIITAIQTYIPQIELIEGSYIIDHPEKAQIRTLYLEIEKKDKQPLKNNEIKFLRFHLPRELKSHIETVIHPIFMYRNEEETMRNILTLSKQLKFVTDIPQCIISFHKQTDSEIVFTVILLRLVKPETLGIKEIFQHLPSFLKMQDLDVKIVGLLRKKYPKEANVFEVILDKSPFLRKDYSLDLYKAREEVILELMRLIGEIRDYNGGMISKQNEVFKQLKDMLIHQNIHNDFLLENFFYSLTPTYMQSLLSPEMLLDAFIMVLDVIDHDYTQDFYTVKTKTGKNHFLLVLGVADPSFQEQLLEINTQDLVISSISMYDISCLSFILRTENPNEHHQFHRKILKMMNKWKERRQYKFQNENLLTL